MAKKRKVNAPVREKKRQQKEEAEKRKLRDAQRRAAEIQAEYNEPAPAEGGGPSRKRGKRRPSGAVPMPGYVKAWMIVDIIFCGLHLIGFFSRATNLPPDLPILFKVSLALSLAIAGCGLPAAILVLIGKQQGVVLGWITVFVTGLSIVTQLLLAVGVAGGLDLIAPQYTGWFAAAFLIAIVVRIDLMFFYGIALSRANQAFNEALVPGAAKFETPERSPAMGFAVTIGVLAGISLAIVVSIAVFKKVKGVEDTSPWASYRDRIEVTPTPAGPEKKYNYRENEVKHWVAGVKNKRVRQSDFEEIISIAARWLTIEDATEVILAAAEAHPEWNASVAPHAAKLMEATQPSDPASRELRNKLKAIAESEPAPN